MDKTYATFTISSMITYSQKSAKTLLVECKTTALVPHDLSCFKYVNKTPPTPGVVCARTTTCKRGIRRGNPAMVKTSNS